MGVVLLPHYQPQGHKFKQLLKTALHTELYKTSVRIALLVALLLELVEIVRHSHPQHTAFVLVAVLKSKYCIVRGYFPFCCVEYISNKYR